MRYGVVLDSSYVIFFFFSSRRRHTRFDCDWSSDVCSSDLLRGVSFEVTPGSIFSIIGPNGAGKTTMINVISGVYHPDPGRIWFAGGDRTRLGPQRVAELGIARTFQNVALFKGLTVLDNVLIGRHIFMRSGLFRSGL